MNKSSGMRDMTVGSPAGHILYFALPLLLGQADSPIPIFDTTRIHAESAAPQALAG